jgi:CheY-like chemotaxis protein
MKGSLTGRSILVVEDEPIIAMAISQALEESGAEVTTTNTLRHALLLAEHDGLSAAILDHSLGDGSSSLLYARLKERGIPFLIYSGFERVEGACPGVPAYHQTSVPPGAPCGGGRPDPGDSNFKVRAMIMPLPLHWPPGPFLRLHGRLHSSTRGSCAVG